MFRVQQENTAVCMITVHGCETCTWVCSAAACVVCSHASQCSCGPSNGHPQLDFDDWQQSYTLLCCSAAFSAAGMLRVALVKSCCKCMFGPHVQCYVCIGSNGLG